MHSRQFVVVGLLSVSCNSVLDIGDYKLRPNTGGTSGLATHIGGASSVGGSNAGGATSEGGSNGTGVAGMGLGGTESTVGGEPSAGHTSIGGAVGTGGINTAGAQTDILTSGGAAAGTTAGGATVMGGSGLGDTHPTSGGTPATSAVVTGGNPADGGAMPTGGNTSAGGATSPGASNATGGAFATGGDISTTASATGGDTPTGGAFAAGGDVSTSTASATGGNAPTGGTSALASTIAIVPECAGKAPGDRVCNGQFIEICGPNLASVQTVDMCINQACVNGACQGDCVPQKKRCNGTIPQTCTDTGQWDGYTACVGATPICNAGTCGTCPSNSGSQMITLPLGYCIDSTEVTQRDYKDWLDSKAPPATPENQPAECSLNKKFTPDCSASNPTSPTLWPPTISMLDHPVVCVDWCDAYAYCAGMGKRLCGNIHGGSLGINDYQDASISQWYAACTSGGIFPSTSFPYGSPYQPNYCNDGTQAAVAVGSKPLCQSTITGYTGVYDLSGNVAEWEDACSGSDASALCRIRGGAYWHLEDLDDGLACGSPDYYSRVDAYDSLGFRCCYP